MIYVGQSKPDQREEPTAHQLGVTILQACLIYRLPYVHVRRQFIYGRKEAPELHPIGRRDTYDVWFADPRDLRERFGPPVREQTALRSAAAQRAVSQVETLRAMLKEQARG